MDWSEFHLTASLVPKAEIQSDPIQSALFTESGRY